MAAPHIFKGKNAQQLNAGGILLKDGTLILNDGELNYIENWGAEVNATGWSAYADAAGTIPVDGTGGSPTTTLTRNTTTPLRGDADFKIIKDAANRQGEGASYDFTIDKADTLSTITIKFDYSVTVNFVNDDVTMFIYDVTNAAVITLNNDAGLKGGGKFQGTFLSTDSTSYRLIFHIASTNAGAYDVNFDKVFVGVTPVSFGPAMSDFIDKGAIGLTAVTTDPTKGTTTEDRILVKRVGDENFYKIEYHQTVAGTAGSGVYLIELPDGAQADPDKISIGTDSNKGRCGEVNILQGTVEFEGWAYMHDSTHLAVLAHDLNNVFLDWGPNFTLANSIVHLELRARVPILNQTTNTVNSESKTFRISTFIKNGTRVTATPTVLGEFRTYVKTISAQTGTDTAPTQTQSDMALNGMRIFSTVFASAGTGGNPDRWEIFVGKNKNIRFEDYESTGRTDLIDTTLHETANETEYYGTMKSYDPTTGLVVIDSIIQNASTTTRAVGRTQNTAGAAPSTVTDAYFEIVVSDNNFLVEIASNFLGSVDFDTRIGSGSTDTKIARYTDANTVVNGTGLSENGSTAANGSVVTVEEDGILDVTVFGTHSVAGDSSVGISINSNQLTISSTTITLAHFYGSNMITTAATNSGSASATGVRVFKGDKIRQHHATNAPNGTRARFRATLRRA